MGLAVGTAKYLLFFFNFIFFITGIAIIAVGGVTLSNVEQLKDFDSTVTSAPVLLIIVGVFVALISFFGCCGAIKHNYCMLVIFAVLLAIIFILELAAGITAYVKRDSLEKSLEESFTESLKSNDSEKMKWWNDWQKQEHCCGVTEAEDWVKANKTVPASCCNNSTGSTTPLPTPVPTTVTDFTGATTITAKPKPKVSIDSNCDYYKEGCFTQLEHLIEKHIVVIGGVGVGIAFVQLLGIVYACCLASAVKQ